MRVTCLSKLSSIRSHKTIIQHKINEETSNICPVTVPDLSVQIHSAGKIIQMQVTRSAIRCGPFMVYFYSNFHIYMPSAPADTGGISHLSRDPLQDRRLFQNLAHVTLSYLPQQQPPYRILILPTCCSKSGTPSNIYFITSALQISSINTFLPILPSTHRVHSRVLCAFRSKQQLLLYTSLANSYL